MVWRSKGETVCGCCLFCLLQASLFFAAPALLPVDPDAYPQLDVSNVGEEARPRYDALQPAFTLSPRDDDSAANRHPYQLSGETIEESLKPLADTIQWDYTGLRMKVSPDHDDKEYDTGGENEGELKQLGGQFYQKTISSDDVMLRDSEGPGRVANNAKDSADDKKRNSGDLDKNEDGENTLNTDDANDEELKKLASVPSASNADEADLRKLRTVSEEEYDGKSLQNAFDVGFQDQVADSEEGRSSDNHNRGYRDSSAREKDKLNGDYAKSPDDLPNPESPTSKVEDYKSPPEENKESTEYLTSDVESTEINDDKRNREDAVGKDEEWTSANPSLRVIELNTTIYINTTDDQDQPQFQPVAIPERFEDYDVNKDGVISLPELSQVTGAVEGAMQAFRDADVNGNGWIDEVEFKSSGWGTPVVLYSPSSPIDVAD